MNSSESAHPENTELKKTPLALTVFCWEYNLSEAVYKFWCRITGGRFEKRKKESPDSCVLVTKRGFHLFSKLLSRNVSFTALALEVYQMNCPEKVPYGLGGTAYYYRFPKFCSNCSFCGRRYEVQAGDKKIVGKF